MSASEQLSYCTILLNPDKKADILAACIQAHAAIQAGREQANAALMVGLATIFTAVFVGGFFGLKSASRPVRLAERRDRLATKAYRGLIASEVELVKNEITERQHGIRAPVIDDVVAAYARPPRHTIKFDGRLSDLSEWIQAGELKADTVSLRGNLKVLLDQWSNVQAKLQFSQGHINRASLPLGRLAPMVAVYSRLALRDLERLKAELSPPNSFLKRMTQRWSPKTWQLLVAHKSATEWAIQEPSGIEPPTSCL